MLVVEIAYHMSRAAEKRKHVNLRLDMFILTFAIYGIMNMVALLVFLVELKIGKRTKVEKSKAQDELDNQTKMVQESPHNPDETNIIEIS